MYLLSVRNIFYQVLIALPCLGLPVILVMQSCDESSEIGANLIDESVNFRVVDSFTVNVATIKFDSLPTSNSGRLLVGQSSDPYLGQITCKAYFQAGYTTITGGLTDDITYDSIAFLLKRDSYYYYDTSGLQSYELYQLTEEIKLDDDGLLYNFSEVPYETVPATTLSFTPGRERDLDDDGFITARLSDQLGNLLFDMAQDDDPKFYDNAQLVPFLKGFVLSPVGHLNGGIFGFTDESKIRIYGSEKNVDPAPEVWIDLELSAFFHFNNITTSGGPINLQLLSNQEDTVPSRLTNHQAFVSGGTGYMMRVDFPSLQTYVQNISNEVIIYEANLILPPLKNSYNPEISRLTGDLTIYQADRQNRLNNTINAPYTLEYDGEFNEATRYKISIKPFIENELLRDEFSKDGLLISLTSEAMVSSVNRLIVDDGFGAANVSLELLLMDLRNGTP